MQLTLTVVWTVSISAKQLRPHVSIDLYLTWQSNCLHIHLSRHYYALLGSPFLAWPKLLSCLYHLLVEIIENGISKITHLSSLYLEIRNDHRAADSHLTHDKELRQLFYVFVVLRKSRVQLLNMTLLEQCLESCAKRIIKKSIQ